MIHKYSFFDDSHFELGEIIQGSLIFIFSWLATYFYSFETSYLIAHLLITVAGVEILSSFQILNY